MTAVTSKPKAKYTHAQIRRAPAMIAVGGMLVGWSLASILYHIVDHGVIDIGTIAGRGVPGLFALVVLMNCFEALKLRDQKRD
jgi:hypothetical protein